MLNSSFLNKDGKIGLMLQVKESHLAEYGKYPEVVVSAPGRFHLIGENTWFFRDKALSMAVNLPVYVSISKRDDNVVKFYFTQLDDRKKANLSNLKFKKEDRWANAIKSVLYGFLSGGVSLGGMDITVYSSILPSAGFGITTAIKVAVAKAVWNIFALHFDEAMIVQVVERGNRLFLLQENHNADNFAAIYARKGFLICTDYYSNSYEHVPFDFEDKKVILVDAKVPRYEMWNRETLYEPENALILGDLREEKKNLFGGWHYISDVTDINEALSSVSEDTRRKLLCVIREHGDVLDAVQACEKKDFVRFARSVNHSHESLRDFFDLSCPEIEWLVKRVADIDPTIDDIRNPVSCGRITGKGFGRCMYAILRKDDVPKFESKLDEYERIFGFKPECYDVESADGVRIIEDD